MAENTEKVESGPDARRRILNIAVSTVLLETGFDAANKMALETLTEMLQCCESAEVATGGAKRPAKAKVQRKSKGGSKNTVAPPIPPEAGMSRPGQTVRPTTFRKPKNEPMYDDFDITGFNGITPYHCRNRLAITVEGFIPLVEKEFNIISTKEPHFAKTISQSMFLYYCIQHLYAQLIYIKKSDQGELPLVEEQFLELVNSGNYTIPDPIKSYINVLSEVGNSAKGYCELSGRVEPVLGDVVMALINMGINLQGLEQYAARPNRHVIQPPQQAPVPRTPAMLSAGSKAKPAPHIPFHLPPLPDPHAYIRTPTHKQPVTEYEAIREKAASQKRDIERALTKFLAKTGETHNLFNTEDNQVFPLIACKPTFPAYLPCLLPTDQVFDFDELEYHFQVANRTEDMPADKKEPSDNEGDNMGDGENPNSSQMDNQDTMASSPERSKAGG